MQLSEKLDVSSCLGHALCHAQPAAFLGPHLLKPSAHKLDHILVGGFCCCKPLLLLRRLFRAQPRARVCNVRGDAPPLRECVGREK